eukprot:1028600-Pyramimonas_sp.AAC.1
MIIRKPRRRATKEAGPHSGQGPNLDGANREAQDHENRTNGTSDDAGSNPSQRDEPDTPDKHSEDGEDSTTADDMEPWVDYIQRATRRAEHPMKFHHIDNWETLHKRK